MSDTLLRGAATDLRWHAKQASLAHRSDASDRMHEEADACERAEAQLAAQQATITRLREALTGLLAVSLTPDHGWCGHYEQAWYCLSADEQKQVIAARARADTALKEQK